MPAISSRLARPATLGCVGRGGHTYADDSPDPFAVNPIRRSFGLVAVSGLIVGIPWWIGGAVATTVMVSVGWLAVTGLVMGLPILVWSLIEEGWRRGRRRVRPTIDRLDLSPRVAHILLRHGLTTIVAVERTSDASLLLLSNMDPRGLRELRRAVSLWKYRRWQEHGFPATGWE